MLACLLAFRIGQVGNGQRHGGAEVAHHDKLHNKDASQADAIKKLYHDGASK